ncbi:MAG: ATP-binding protein [Pseudomonadota bacterium]
MRQSDAKPKNLIPLYLLAGALIVVMVVTSHVMAIRALHGGGEAALAINRSGFQRLLTQRIAHLTLLEHLEGEGGEATEELDAALERFAEGHRALYYGGALGLSESGAIERRPIAQVWMDGSTLDQRVADYMRRVERARAGDDKALAAVTSIELTAALVDHLNIAVQSMQALSESRVRRAETISFVTTVAALLVLMCEAICIFVPAQRAINRSFQSLVKTTDALQVSKRELQTALGEADIARGYVEEMLDKRRRSARELASDLSRPLLSLDTALRVLKVSNNDPEQAHELAEARNAAQRVRKSIQVAFGSDGTLTSGGLLDEGPVDLRQFVDSLMVITSVWAHQKGLECNHVVDDKLPETIILDCPRMERILINLLNNAVKYTNEGGVRLEVASCGRSLMRFAVSDTGQGIPEGGIDQLFRSYRGQEANTASAASGTGLGLAICHEFTEMMGGTIRAESTLGEGSTFTVTIPLKELENVHDIAAQAVAV